MINSAQIEQLLKRFHDHEISYQEYLELMNELKAKGNDEAFFKAMDGLWQNPAPVVSHSKEEEEELYHRITLSPQFNRGQTTKKLFPWYKYAAAAILLVALSTGIYLFTVEHNAKSSNFLANDIAPGGNKAMLILSDGKKIDLEKVGNGELVHQAGMSIVKTADGKLVYHISETDDEANNNLESTIVTPKGGQYEVNLPDGSRVWLNAASSLKFPLQFKGAERKVSLTGEAYFEVAKKYTAKHEYLPFYVSTPTQRVTVLGTHFNINAYAASPTTKTTLLEGAVKVNTSSTINLREEVSYLKPGEQSIVSTGSMKVVKADVEETMAWKNGLFIFNGQDLGRIMADVARWYNVDVVFEDENLKNNAFSGSTSRFKNISQLLEVLESTGSVHFKVEGRRVTVMD
jgi:transmembrane sensor